MARGNFVVALKNLSELILRIRPVMSLHSLGTPELFRKRPCSSSGHPLTQLYIEWLLVTGPMLGIHHQNRWRSLSP